MGSEHTGDIIEDITEDTSNNSYTGIVIIIIIFIIVGIVYYLLQGEINDQVKYIYNKLQGINETNKTCSDKEGDKTNVLHSCPSGMAMKIPIPSSPCPGDSCSDDYCCATISDGGSVNNCRRPAASQLNNYNITNISETDLSISNFNVSGITCKSGYEGTVETRVCTRPGGQYSITGCHSHYSGICNKPANENGYVDLPDTLPISMNASSISEASCSQGYTRRPNITSPTYTCSTPNSDYSVSGCEPDPCTLPIRHAGWDARS